jgi:hypothetical protein
MVISASSSVRSAGTMQSAVKFSVFQLTDAVPKTALK